MALLKSFDKEYNISNLFTKRRQNFNQKLFDNQTQALTKRESKFSAGNSFQAIWGLVDYI